MAAHHRGLYRGRVFIAAAALFLTSWILYSMFQFAGRTSSSLGLQIFAMQAWAGFIFACGAFTATSDAISQEKRDGTLGLLFLTTLKGRDVILGKLVSALSLFVGGAIATLPILTLPILLGGIRLSQSFHLLVSLLNTMLLSAAAGLFASSMSLKRQKSAGLATLIVVSFCGILPLMILTLRKMGMFNAAFVAGFFTPLFPQQLASGALSGWQLQYFWISTAIIFSISCALLAAASFITPRTWQQRAKEPFLKRLTECYAAWSVRTIKSRSKLGRALLDRNAYEWLAARELSAATKAWTFIIAIVLLAVACIANFVRHNDPAVVYITACLPALYLIQINLKTRIGGHAADRFSAERECGAFELLLCTPLSIGQMVRGEFHALRRHFLWPALATIALFVSGLVLSFGGIDRVAQLFTVEGDPLFRRASFLVIGAGAYFLWLDAVALAWAGAWCGLVSRVQRARTNTMALVVALPCLVLLVLLPALLQSATVRAYFHEAGFYPQLAMGIAFLTACDLAVIVFARRWLSQKARLHFTNPIIHSREEDSFFSIFTANADRKPPLNIGNGAKAAEFNSVQSVRAD